MQSLRLRELFLTYGFLVLVVRNGGFIGLPAVLPFCSIPLLDTAKTGAQPGRLLRTEHVRVRGALSDLERAWGEHRQRRRFLHSLEVQEVVNVQGIGQQSLQAVYLIIELLVDQLDECGARLKVQALTLLGLRVLSPLVGPLSSFCLSSGSSARRSLRS